MKFQYIVNGILSRLKRLQQLDKYFQILNYPIKVILQIWVAKHTIQHEQHYGISKRKSDQNLKRKNKGEQVDISLCYLLSHQQLALEYEKS